MSHPKSLKPMLRNAAPPMKPCNLVSRMRRIRWEMAITKDRTRDPTVADELARLVQQTDDAIERIEIKHQVLAQ
jgi:hypothetical protein